MADDLHAGDRVSWNAHGGKRRSKGKAEGKVVRKLTETTKVEGHAAKATKDDPQYLVETDEGKRAAHKPSALTKRG
jgi:hypothetical protein